LIGLLTFQRAVFQLFLERESVQQYRF
jgi:hypothetical protein